MYQLRPLWCKGDCIDVQGDVTLGRGNLVAYPTDRERPLLSVSKRQVLITTSNSSEGLILNNIGLNSIFIRRYAAHPNSNVPLQDDKQQEQQWDEELLKGQSTTLSVGDIFTVTGYFYAFEVIRRADKQKDSVESANIGESRDKETPTQPQSAIHLQQPSAQNIQSAAQNPSASSDHLPPLPASQSSTESLSPKTSLIDITIQSESKQYVGESEAHENSEKEEQGCLQRTLTLVQTEEELSIESQQTRVSSFVSVTSAGSDALITFSSAPDVSFLKLLADSAETKTTSTSSGEIAPAKTELQQSDGSIVIDDHSVDTAAPEKVEVVASDGSKNGDLSRSVSESVESHVEEFSTEGSVERRKSSRKRKKLFEVSQLNSLYSESQDPELYEPKKTHKRRKMNDDDGEFKVKKSNGAKGNHKKSAKHKPPVVEQIISSFATEMFSSACKTAVLYHESCLQHRVPDWHLERPARLQTVIDVIKMVQDRFGASMLLKANDFEPCPMDWVSKCHDADYLEKMQGKIPEDDIPLHATMTITQAMLLDSDIPRDTFVSKGSWNAALLSAGAVCKAVDIICSPNRQARNAFCAVRPPGHHAGRKGHARAASQGYCLINNVAIGATYAKHQYNVERICVLDFDVHAGNGTAELLEGKENILFISLHCNDIYPFDEMHKPEDMPKLPNIFNAGFKEGASRKSMLRLFDNKIRPKMEEFKPNLIFLSAGFDAHVEDPTSAGTLTHDDYQYITAQVKEIAAKYAEGRIISVLEGGYNLEALKKSVLAHLCELMRA